MFFQKKCATHVQLEISDTISVFLFHEGICFLKLESELHFNHFCCLSRFKNQRKKKDLGFSSEKWAKNGQDLAQELKRYNNRCFPMSLPTKEWLRWKGWHRWKCGLSDACLEVGPADFDKCFEKNLPSNIPCCDIFLLVVLVRLWLWLLLWWLLSSAMSNTIIIIAPLPLSSLLASSLLLLVWANRSGFLFNVSHVYHFCK